MPLPAGSRLGPYEIIDLLGAGGMGEVYKARDVRLDRIVALKRMLGTMAGDGDSIARFDQEARAIAALNHPHICTIYDVGHDGGVDYFVMEYLAGETLAQYLERTRRALGPHARAGLPLDLTIAIALQIAAALDRAHSAGIVHRDLKPANIMLLGVPATESSVRRQLSPELRVNQARAPTVKLLDFGLARMVAPPSIGDVSQAMTMVAAPSDRGMFIGTMQYMAPEQLEGAEVDARSDIFAFGIILYEMLTGARTFDGASAASLTAAILERDPTPLSQHRSDVSPLLEHVVMRCLEKIPAQRWQDVADVGGELRWLAANPQPASASVAVAAHPPRRRWTMAALWLALAAAVVAAGARWYATPEPRALDTVRFDVPTPPAEDPSAMAVSPDGRELAYVAKGPRGQQLWVRAFDRLEPRALAGTEGAVHPFWSPDGRSLAFFADGKLKRIDAAGGAPFTLADAPTPRGGAWGPDGVILFTAGISAPISRIAATGGAVARVTEPGPATGPAHRYPQFLPDGRRFIFQSALGTAETNGVYVASLDGGQPARVAPSEFAARFVAPSTLVIGRQGSMIAVDFDPATATVGGNAAVIAQGFSSGVGYAAFSASNTGVIAYRVGGGQRRQLTWLDRQGRTLGTIGDPASDSLAAPELSPDERTLAVFRQPLGPGGNDIWLLDLARVVFTRVTAGPPASASPLWTADGRSLLFTSLPDGVDEVFERSAGGGGDSQRLLRAPYGTPLSTSADGRYLVVRGVTDATRADIFLVDLTGDRTPVPIAQTRADETEAQISPDGRWLAIVSNEPGRPEVYLQPFPSSSARVQVSANGGSQVRWAPSGKELFFVAADGTMTAVAVMPGAGALPDVGAPRALFHVPLPSGANILDSKPQYVVARDGRFLVNAAVDAASTPPITVVLNWRRHAGQEK